MVVDQYDVFLVNLDPALDKIEGAAITEVKSVLSEMLVE